MIAAKGFETLTTALYPEDDPYLGSDAVFGVKRSLVVVHFSFVSSVPQLLTQSAEIFGCNRSRSCQEPGVRGSAQSRQAFGPHFVLCTPEKAEQERKLLARSLEK
jgi:hypothetical protein